MTAPIAMPALSIAMTAAAGCATGAGEHSLTQSVSHGDWTARLAGYGSADSAEKLDAFVTRHCDGPFTATQRSASDDGQLRHMKFECGAPQ